MMCLVSAKSQERVSSMMVKKCMEMTFAVTKKGKQSE